jgi:hypothetical protein
LRRANPPDFTSRSLKISSPYSWPDIAS